MGKDYFAILGLAPGNYNAAEINGRFQAERARLLTQLDNPAAHSAVRHRLDDLHLAYAALREPRQQAEHLRTRVNGADDVTQLRQLIAAALEGGLLRYSRRQEIITEAQRLGFSDFQTQLLIAQVQFGDDQFQPATPGSRRAARAESSRAWARFAAAGVLALAMFLALVRWLGS